MIIEHLVDSKHRIDTVKEFNVIFKIVNRICIPINLLLLDMPLTSVLKMYSNSFTKEGVYFTGTNRTASSLDVLVVDLALSSELSYQKVSFLINRRDSNYLIYVIGDFVCN